MSDKRQAVCVVSQVPKWDLEGRRTVRVGVRRCHEGEGVSLREWWADNCEKGRGGLSTRQLVRGRRNQRRERNFRNILCHFTQVKLTIVHSRRWSTFTVFRSQKWSNRGRYRGRGLCLSCIIHNLSKRKLIYLNILGVLFLKLSLIPKRVQKYLGTLSLSVSFQEHEGITEINIFFFVIFRFTVTCLTLKTVYTFEFDFSSFRK